MGWPILAAAAANMTSSMYNRAAAEEANETNLQMAHIYNAGQKELARYKYARDLEQWNRQNDYNSPLSQKTRMLQAGLNPALQQISTGTATSSPEMAMPQTTAGRVDPVPQIDLATPVLNAYSAYVQNQRLKAETDGMLIDNQTKNLRNLASLNEILSRTRGENARAAGQELLNNTFNRHNELDLQLKENQIKNIQSKTELNILEGFKKHDELMVLPQKLQMELAQYAANVVLTRANVDVARAELSKKLQETEGLRISNDQARKISNYIIMKAQYDAIPTPEEEVNKLAYENRGKFNFYGYFHRAQKLSVLKNYYIDNFTGIPYLDKLF